MNNKVIWKSFKAEEGRLTYPVISLGDTTYTGLKDFIERLNLSVINYAHPNNLQEANSPMAVEEGSEHANVLEKNGQNN